MRASGHEIEFGIDNGFVTARAVDVQGIVAQGRTRIEALSRLIEKLGNQKCKS